MGGVLVDSCTVIDVADSGSRWHEVSVAVLEAIDDGVPLLVDPVTYAECSVGFGRLELLEDFLDAVELGYEELPEEALFVAGFRLATREVSRFAGCFPRVELIVPGEFSR